MKHNCTKRGIIHSLFNFLFSTSSSAEEITAIKNKGNQDVLSSKIEKTFNFINLTLAETDKNRLLLKVITKRHCSDKQYCPSPF